MKRAKIFLLLFTLCCELTACGTKPADDVPPPDDETSAVDIEWFNTEFFNVGSSMRRIRRAGQCKSNHGRKAGLYRRRIGHFCSLCVPAGKGIKETLP